jgi:hypothetical protein
MDEVFFDDVVFDYSSIGLAPMGWTAMKEWLRDLPKAAMGAAYLREYAHQFQ